MHFVEDGFQALERAEQTPFDVVVSDMRMPGMDGATLLRHVRERQPGAVRIILSGYASHESATRGAPLAHQFLSKPCDVERLTNAISRTLSLRQLVSEEKLRSAIGRVDNLPARPEIYARLMALLENPETSMVEAAEVVERDVAITAKLLQVVNSAFFGLPRRITSVSEAVNYLGISTVKALTLAFEAARCLASDESISCSDVELFEDHALLASRICSQMLVDKVAKEDAFAAALLHDVGQLVLAQQLPEQRAECIAMMQRDSLSLPEAEQAILGVTHAEVGGYLLGLWGLPFSVVEAVALHHRPEVSYEGDFGVVEAVHVAVSLAEEALGGAEAKLDEAYLLACGAAERLSRWRHLAQAAGSA